LRIFVGLELVQNLIIDLVRITYECTSAGTTDIFNMRPVRRYASRKVIDPRVKNVAYQSYTCLDTSQRGWKTDLFCPALPNKHHE
jgi:hypothetical protein